MSNLYFKVLDSIHDGMRIVFTPDNVADGDDFLIFSNANNNRITATFHMTSVPFIVEFDCDEPMRLEDCPDSFLRSIIKNATK